MIKWVDEIEKQIDILQDEIDGIEAGDVDAKNLSEVLDKDAPVTLTTDLANNKVKIGVNIDKTAPITASTENNKLTLGLDYDTETLELDNGKLKVKSSGGAQKYWHRILLTIGYLSTAALANNTYTHAYLDIINDSATPIEWNTFAQLMYDMHASNYDKFFVIPAVNATSNGEVYVRRLSRIATNKCACQLINKVLTTDGSAITFTENFIDIELDYYNQNRNYFDVTDTVTTL